MQPDTRNDVPDEALTPLGRWFLWVESAAAVKRAIYGLGALCAVLFVLDFLVHRHSYAPYEHVPGFYALVGFLGFSFVVLASGALRWFIRRGEDFYAPNSVDVEAYPDAGLERKNHPGVSTPGQPRSGE